MNEPSTRKYAESRSGLEVQAGDFDCRVGSQATEGDFENCFSEPMWATFCPQSGVYITTSGAASRSTKSIPFELSLGKRKRKFTVLVSGAWVLYLTLIAPSETPGKVFVSVDFGSNTAGPPELFSFNMDVPATKAVPFGLRVSKKAHKQLATVQEILLGGCCTGENYAQLDAVRGASKKLTSTRFSSVFSRASAVRSTVAPEGCFAEYYVAGTFDRPTPFEVKYQVGDVVSPAFGLFRPKQKQWVIWSTLVVTDGLATVFTTLWPNQGPTQVIVGSFRVSSSTVCPATFNVQVHPTRTKGQVEMATFTLFPSRNTAQIKPKRACRVPVLRNTSAPRLMLALEEKRPTPSYEIEGTSGNRDEFEEEPVYIEPTITPFLDLKIADSTRYKDQGSCGFSITVIGSSLGRQDLEFTLKCGTLTLKVAFLDDFPHDTQWDLVVVIILETNAKQKTTKPKVAFYWRNGRQKFFDELPEMSVLNFATMNLSAKRTDEDEDDPARTKIVSFSVFNYFSGQ